ncbi:MAG: SixA phosphatase family protein [Janthinobacterium lividum]
MTFTGKNLILMRHADSLQATDSNDLERTLSLKGIQQATEATKFLCSYRIDKILVSPATRTRQTMEAVLKEMVIDQIEIREEIYKENKQNIFATIVGQPDEIKSLMIIGHNPEICALIFDIIDNNDSNYEKLMKVLMPPASIIVINIPDASNWSDLSYQCSGKVINIFLAHE